MSVIEVTVSVIRRHNECDKGVAVNLYYCGE